MSVMAVARDQAGDLIRRRYLIVILILCVALIGMWIGYLSLMKVFMESAAKGRPGQDAMSAAEARQMSAFMTSALQVGLLGTVSAIATVLSVALMAFSVRGDISKGTIRMALSRPVPRWEYFLGKWLGCVFTVSIYWMVMAILVCGYMYFAFGGVKAIVPLSLGMLLLKAVMVGSVAMALAMFVHPLITIMITYLAAGETFLTISRLVSDNGIARRLLEAVFCVLPSYKAFDVYQSMMSGRMPETDDIVYRIAYALVLSTIMLLIGMAAFRRKDMI